MSREIKFRGKRLDNGEWVYGSLITAYNGDTWIFESAVVEKVQAPFPHGKMVGVDREYCNQVDHKTVGMYSNVNDMHGNRIYEGDEVTIDYGRCEVEFHHGCFMIRFLDDPEAMMELLSMEYKHGRIRKELQLTGRNSIDNPELPNL